jgi:hypothetical protein
LLYNMCAHTRTCIHTHHIYMCEPLLITLTHPLLHLARSTPGSFPPLWKCKLCYQDVWPLPHLPVSSSSMPAIFLHTCTHLHPHFFWIPSHLESISNSLAFSVFYNCSFHLSSELGQFWLGRFTTRSDKYKKYGSKRSTKLHQTGVTTLFLVLFSSFLNFKKSSLGKGYQSFFQFIYLKDMKQSHPLVTEAKYR